MKGEIRVEKNSVKSFFLRVIKSKVVLPLVCAAGLIGVVIGAGFSYAKYVDSQSELSRAGVAVFDVNDGLEDKSFTLSVSASDVEGGMTSNILVTNSGEVAIRYTVQVENITNNLPLTFKCETARIGPNEQTNYQISIFYAGDEEGLSTTYCGMVDLIRVTVTIEQTVS
jgi:hypothetical protein